MLNQSSTIQQLSSPADLTLEDALAELAELQRQRYERPPGARTAKEWGLVWGTKAEKTRRILKGLVECGRMRATQQPVLDVAGRSNTTVVYQVVAREHPGQA